MMKTTMHWVVRHGGLPYLMRAHLGSRATIVSYHGVVSDEDWRDWETSDMVSVSAFRRHLTFYRRHYDVIPLRRVADALAGRGPKLPRRSLAITLDDGYCNNLHCALPVLREHDCPATVFVTTGFLDGTVELWWLPVKRRVLAAQKRGERISLDVLGAFDVPSPAEGGLVYRRILSLLKRMNSRDRARCIAELGRQCSERDETLERVYAPLTWAEARAMAQTGVEIGAHGATHAILAQEDSEAERREIVESVGRVREELGVRDLPFSYPNGQRDDFTDTTEDLVREGGCYAACANFPGWNGWAEELYRLRRFAVGGFHTVAALDLDLCGLRLLIQRLARRSRAD